jgi:hypothetical protein
MFLFTSKRARILENTSGGEKEKNDAKFQKQFDILTNNSTKSRIYQKASLCF